MPRSAFQLRQQLYGEKDAKTGELARDVQRAFKQVPFEQHKTVDTVYKTPIVIGDLDEEPFCIELVRVANLSSVTAPPNGGPCNFTWLPSQGGAVIASLAGFSAGSTIYRLYFRITYRLAS